jgi:hypothetical protein
MYEAGVLIVVNIQVFWDVTPYILLDMFLCNLDAY